MSVMDDSDHLSVEPDAVELNFRELRASDEGVYRCHATNAEGSRSHDVQILFASTFLRKTFSTKRQTTHNTTLEYNFKLQPVGWAH